MDLAGLAERLKGARKLRRLASTRLETLAGVSRGTVGLIEAKKCPYVALRVVDALSLYLKVELEWLVRGTYRRRRDMPPIAPFLERVDLMPGLRPYLMSPKGMNHGLDVVARVLSNLDENAPPTTPRDWHRFFGLPVNAAQ